MALRLTHENLPAAYEYLRACKPFCDWKLPEADEVGFEVSRRADRYGHMSGDLRTPGAVIAVSEVCVGSTARLMETMAHEMIHLRQHLRKTETRAQHNAEFKRLAAQVCAEHIFDPRSFS